VGLLRVSKKKTTLEQLDIIGAGEVVQRRPRRGFGDIERNN